MSISTEIVETIAYRTLDGAIFSTQAEARAHVAQRAFLHWYRYNALHSGASGDLVDGADMAAWLADNRAAVLDLLMARTDGERHAV